MNKLGKNKGDKGGGARVLNALRGSEHRCERRQNRKPQKNSAHDYG